LWHCPFTVAEYKPNEILRLKKNPDYWQKGLPLLDEVVFRSIPDINARGTMLLAGDADMALELTVADREKIKNTKGYSSKSKKAQAITTFTSTMSSLLLTMSR